jgi:hypothetical protein
MCEFCSFNGKHVDRDSTNPSFAGFFSPDAIQAAIDQASASSSKKSNQNARNQDDDDDSDEDESDADSDGT